MRIDESPFLSLSLLCIEEICLFVVIGKDILSGSQQAKEKESINTMRCDALRCNYQVVLINLVKY